MLFFKTRIHIIGFVIKFATLKNVLIHCTVETQHCKTTTIPQLKEKCFEANWAPRRLDNIYENTLNLGLNLDFIMSNELWVYENGIWPGINKNCQLLLTRSTACWKYTKNEMEENGLWTFMP